MEANLAVLIDFENIAAGTEKEGLGRFDVDALMKRLKDKGRILVARSYGDWGRFARFKQGLLMANVTMMELTSHGMQDKNRADIAMVVDCLELAFTKDYIDTFVVVSGDSDFTPLVLKMRELNKRVIGCGTRSSTSRLLIQACDEFLFYDTIVKEARPAPAPARPGIVRHDEAAFDMLVDALEGIQRENPEPCHASIVKTAVLRKSPDFNEGDLGYASFARFLEAAAEAGHVKLSRDQKGGGYRVDSSESPDGASNNGPAPQSESGRESWVDGYLPEGSAAAVEKLSKAGLNPLAYPTRMAVLQAAEEAVGERKKRRRRITVPFVQDDVKKRLGKSHPELPTRAIRAVFDALLKAGLLVHKDGQAIRSPSAAFGFDKDAEKLNAALTPMYLSILREGGNDPGNSAMLASLFLGSPERKREIEEAVAWSSRPIEEDEGPAENPIDDAEINLDDLLLTEETPAPAPAPKPSRSRAKPAPIEIIDDVLFEEPSVQPAEPVAAPVAVDSAPAESAPVEDEAKREPRRRRTRRPRGAKAEAEGETPVDIDAMLSDE